MSQANCSDAMVVREADGLVWVRVEARQSACGSCVNKPGCAVVDNIGNGQLLCLPNSINAAMGDHVVVEVAAGQVWKAAWQAYGRPLSLAIVAALSTRYFTDSDGYALAAMFMGVAAGFLVLLKRGLDCGKNSSIFSLKSGNCHSHSSSRL